MSDYDSLTFSIDSHHGNLHGGRNVVAATFVILKWLQEFGVKVLLNSRHGSFEHVAATHRVVVPCICLH